MRVRKALCRIYSTIDRRVMRMRSATLDGHEEGQSMVEIALCLPLLFLVVTGICSFGIAFNNYLLLTEATNVGARLLAVSRGQTTDPCAVTASAISTAAPLLKSSSLAYMFVLNGTSYTGSTCSSPNTTSGAAANLVQGATVKVTVTYPCTLRVYTGPVISSCVLTAQTAEMVQ